MCVLLRLRELEAQGASPQRPLWASTGVKNPDLPDTLYVSDLIAPGTVNTMPEKTLKAYADHGTPGTPIQQTYDQAAQVMKAVAGTGVDLDDVFKTIEDEGIQKFVDSWNDLTESVRTELQDKKLASSSSKTAGDGFAPGGMVVSPLLPQGRNQEAASNASATSPP